MSLADFRFIAVEGPIGVGKSSLARRLADYLGAEGLFESPDENPFLERFYADRAKHALAT
jgi:deoxyadenosine/deoxycytidine kinase